MTRGYLGLGSNLGDRLASLTSAVRLLGERGVEVIRSSRVYETDPVGGPAQGPYLNAVVEIEFSGTARELLDAARAVEEAMGRIRTERWGPRVIDVDILTFGDERVDRPDLVIPHPRMHERGFVLIPLLELTADPPLPGGRRAADVRIGPDALSGVRPFAPPLVTEAGAGR
ncbi:MAG TPA: 2-amino-4-hydroxy-6-hydroxymethyldihydropteridine diphosphokinase [Actinomycetota bacterium]|nr:2-amino-4-hydroxy-6-hydroxymethyldihydropteridine diphosphokinase [Actinomycetota bacterium]